MSLDNIVAGMKLAGTPIRCVELGKIKIGGLGEKRRSREGKEWRLPRKDDFFTITGLARDGNGDLIPDANIMADLAAEGHASPDGKLRQLPIRLLSDDIETVLQARWCWYGRKQVGAVSDGQTVTWRYDPQTMQPYNPPRVEEWNPSMLEMTDKAGNKLFKLHSNFYCSLYCQSGRWGGAYVFRTTSFISFRQIYASLLEISDKTGGVLIGMPLVLCVRPMLVAPDGKASTVFVVHLEIRGSDIQQLQQLAMDQSAFRLKFASSIQRTSQQYKKMLTAPGDEPPDEAAAIADEFVPEDMSAGETDSEPPKLTKAERMAAELARSTPVGIVDHVGPVDEPIPDAVVPPSEFIPDAEQALDMPSPDAGLDSDPLEISEADMVADAIEEIHAAGTDVDAIRLLVNQANDDPTLSDEAKVKIRTAGMDADVKATQAKQIPPATSDTPQVTAASADKLTEIAGMITPLKSLASVDEFGKEILPTIAEAIRPAARKLLYAKRVEFVTKISDCVNVMKEYPDLTPQCNAAIKRIKASRGPNSTSNGGGRT